MTTRAHWLQILLLVGMLASCGGGGGGGPAPGAPSAPTLVLETETSVKKTLGVAGGSLQATGRDGTTYTLTVPRKALSGDTEVTLTPLRAIANLPSGATLSAGAHLTPEGQTFHAPVRLVIELASSPALPLVPFTYARELEGRRLYPAAVSGKTITFEVMHFSGYAALMAQAETMAILLGPDGVFLPPSAPGDQALQALVTASLAPAEPAARDAAMVAPLRGWMDNVIKPRVVAMQAFTSIDIDDFSAGSSNLAEGSLFADLEAFDIAVAYFILMGGSTSNSTALYNDLRIAVRDTARHVIPLHNAGCGSTFGSAYGDTFLIFAWQEFAEHVGAAALDPSLGRASVLEDLCLQVAYDSNGGIDFPSGIQPGQTGTPSVRAGYTINGGPIRFDQPMSMYPDGKSNVTPAGLQVPFSVAAGATQQLQTFLWDPGTQEMRIEVDTCMALVDLQEICKKAFVVRGVPLTCPRYQATVNGQTNISEQFNVNAQAGFSAPGAYGSASIGGNASLFLSSAYAGTSTASADVTYRVEANGDPTTSFDTVWTWRPSFGIDAGGSCSATFSIAGISQTYTSTIEGNEQKEFQYTTRVRHGDVIKMKLQASCSSPGSLVDAHMSSGVDSPAHPVVRFRPELCNP